MMATMMIPGEVLVITNFQTIRSWLSLKPATTASKASWVLPLMECQN